MNSVIVDKEGSAYVSGTVENSKSYSNGTVIFGDDVSLTMPWNYGGSNFACKYTDLGEVAWKKFYTGYSDTNTTSFQVNTAGYVFIKGILLDNYTKSSQT